MSHQNRIQTGTLSFTTLQFLDKLPNFSRLSFLRSYVTEFQQKQKAHSKSDFEQYSVKKNQERMMKDIGADHRGNFKPKTLSKCEEKSYSCRMDRGVVSAHHINQTRSQPGRQLSPPLSCISFYYRKHEIKHKSALSTIRVCNWDQTEGSEIKSISCFSIGPGFESLFSPGSP